MSCGNEKTLRSSRPCDSLPNSGSADKYRGGMSIEGEKEYYRDNWPVHINTPSVAARFTHGSLGIPSPPRPTFISFRGRRQRDKIMSQDDLLRKERGDMKRRNTHSFINSSSLWW